MKTIMKKNWLVLLPALLVIMMASCDLLDKKKDLTAEEAKMEIRAAGEDIMYTMEEMMESPAMSSLLFLSELMDMDFELDIRKSEPTRKQSSLVRLLSHNAKGGQVMMLPGTSRVMNTVRAINTRKSSQNEENGVYHYNFTTKEFDLVNDNVNYIELHFPADEQAYDSRQRNARLRLSNLEIEEVEVYDEYWDEYYVEEVPVSVDATLWLNNQVAMELSYRAQVNENALPVSVSLSMDMPPYTMSLTQSGSNRDYTTRASLKRNNTNILNIDMRLRYTADLEEVEKADGSLKVHPLEIKGEIKPAAMELCETLSCMNNNVKLEMFQTELNKKIGKVEFREYDGDFELAIVYEDGSFEFLEMVFEDIFE